MARKDKDWVCRQCRVQNTAQDSECVVCGMPRIKETPPEPVPEPAPGRRTRPVSKEERTPAPDRPVIRLGRPVVPAVVSCIGVLFAVLFMLLCLCGPAAREALLQATGNLAGTLTVPDFAALPARLFSALEIIWAGGTASLRNLPWGRPFTLAYEKTVQIGQWQAGVPSLSQCFDLFFLLFMLLWLISHFAAMYRERRIRASRHILWRCFRIFLVDILLACAIVLAPEYTDTATGIHCIQAMFSLQTVVLCVVFSASFLLYGTSGRIPARRKRLNICWYGVSTAIMYLASVFVLAN